MRENLKAARTALGYTQQQMADKVGISLIHYQKIEAGDRTGDFSIWIYRGTFSVEAYQGAMSALVAKAEAVRDQTQAAVDELTSAYRLIAG